MRPAALIVSEKGLLQASKIVAYYLFAESTAAFIGDKTAATI